jgi:uncharacterized Rossmann fold enzyme
MKNYANLSDMMIRGWNSKYTEIIQKFGYSKRQDFESAWILNSMIKNPVAIRKINQIIHDKTVFIIGAGPSLSNAIPFLKKYKKIAKIVADGAVEAFLENKITPDIVITDLDGDEKSLKKIGKTNSIILVHGHGDNIAKLQLVKNFKNCIGTTQGNAFGKLYNFGGFTDGDRCVFLADYFGARKVILFGMDFGTKIGKYSKTKVSERKVKIKKLRYAKKLLLWLAKKTKCELYTTSKPIQGFKNICYKDIKDIVTT